MLKRFVSLILLVAVTACLPPPEVGNAPSISFRQFDPFRLNVAEIKIIEDYTPSLNAPHVELRMPTSPSQAMKIWAGDRLRAIGSEGFIEVVIKDASVIAVPLPRTQGVKGAFTKDQSTRYDAKLEVEMRLYHGGAISNANLNVVGSRSQTIAEDASPSEHDALFHRMVEELMVSINAELERNIQQYFNQYLVYTP